MQRYQRVIVMVDTCQAATLLPDYLPPHSSFLASSSLGEESYSYGFDSMVWANGSFDLVWSSDGGPLYDIPLEGFEGMRRQSKNTHLHDSEEIPQSESSPLDSRVEIQLWRLAVSVLWLLPCWMKQTTTKR